MDKETARYIVQYYAHLLSVAEKMAIKHTTSLFKLKAAKNNPIMTRIYREKGWISDEQNVLDLLKDGYDAFELKVAKRILNERQEEVLLNNCLKCGRLARTPLAKQCRHCGHDWH